MTQFCERFENNILNSTKMNGPTPRIVKETNSLKVETVAGIKCDVDPNNFRHFFVKIDGSRLLLA